MATDVTPARARKWQAETRLGLVRRARKINRLLAETYPDAHCELNFDNSFQLLVATVLSAQTTDKRVNLTTPALFELYRRLLAPGGIEVARLAGLPLTVIERAREVLKLHERTEHVVSEELVECIKLFVPVALVEPQPLVRTTAPPSPTGVVNRGIPWESARKRVLGELYLLYRSSTSRP